MYSIAFPKMFTSERTLLIKDHEATLSNLRLLFKSFKTSLLGDPYFGTNLKRFIFEQNNVVLRDLIIDDIYTAIVIFMPQLKLTRKNITIESDGVDIICTVECLNLIDFQTDLFSINLTSEV